MLSILEVLILNFIENVHEINTNEQTREALEAKCNPYISEYMTFLIENMAELIIWVI
jgi:hypothetical protein